LNTIRREARAAGVREERVWWVTRGARVSGPRRKKILTRLAARSFVSYILELANCAHVFPEDSRERERERVCERENESESNHCFLGGLCKETGF